MRMNINGSTLTRWAAIPLRVIVGYGFIAHGYAKVANGPAHFIGPFWLRLPAVWLCWWVPLFHW